MANETHVIFVALPKVAILDAAPCMKRFSLGKKVFNDICEYLGADARYYYDDKGTVAPVSADQAKILDSAKLTDENLSNLHGLLSVLRRLSETINCLDFEVYAVQPTGYSLLGKLNVDDLDEETSQMRDEDQGRNHRYSHDEEMEDYEPKNRGMPPMALFGADSSLALINPLAAHKQLKVLDLSGVVNNNMALVLGGALEGGPESLTRLNLSKNKFDLMSMAAITDGLKKCEKLSSLKMSQNMMGDYGALMVADALSSGAGVTELDLSNNRIGDFGVTAIALSQDIHAMLNAQGSAKTVGDALIAMKHLQPLKQFWKQNAGSTEFKFLLTGPTQEQPRIAYEQPQTEKKQTKKTADGDICMNVMVDNVSNARAIQEMQFELAPREKYIQYATSLHAAKSLNASLPMVFQAYAVPESVCLVPPPEIPVVQIADTDMEAAVDQMQKVIAANAKTVPLMMLINQLLTSQDATVKNEANNALKQFLKKAQVPDENVFKQYSDSAFIDKMLAASTVLFHSIKNFLMEYISDPSNQFIHLCITELLKEKGVKESSIWQELKERVKNVYDTEDIPADDNGVFQMLLEELVAPVINNIAREKISYPSLHADVVNYLHTVFPSRQKELLHWDSTLTKSWFIGVEVFRIREAIKALDKLGVVDNALSLAQAYLLSQLSTDKGDGTALYYEVITRVLVGLGVGAAKVFESIMASPSLGRLHAEALIALVPSLNTAALRQLTAWMLKELVATDLYLVALKPLVSWMKKSPQMDQPLAEEITKHLHTKLAQSNVSSNPELYKETIELLMDISPASTKNALVGLAAEKLVSPQTPMQIKMQSLEVLLRLVFSVQ